MKLVVGLGNPGKEYINTRHNIGYMFLDSFVDGKFSLNSKMEAMECFVNYGSDRILFIKPVTYMNLSGNAVLKYVNYYKIALDDVLIIQDDLDMELGKAKFLFNHSAGGHNGIKDIISKLGSQKFLRLKIGIGNDKKIDTKDYVLDKFNSNDLELLNSTMNSLSSVLDDFNSMNRDMLLQKYNTKI